MAATEHTTSAEQVFSRDVRAILSLFGFQSVHSLKISLKTNEWFVKIER
jgi:hypothetical protein